MSTGAAEQALGCEAAERGRALLALHEDQWFDRKSARIAAKDLADAMIALANAEGGTIVVGLSDGRVEGVDDAPAGRVNEWQQAALDFTVPAVPCRSRLVDCVATDGTANRLIVGQLSVSWVMRPSGSRGGWGRGRRGRA